MFQRQTLERRESPRNKLYCFGMSVVDNNNALLRINLILADATDTNNPLAKSPIKFHYLSPADAARYPNLANKALKPASIPADPTKKTEFMKSLQQGFGVKKIGPQDMIVYYWNGSEGGHSAARLAAAVLSLTEELIPLE